MTMNILDSDWTKHYFTLHFKMWLSPLKSAREVNITFEHCSMYPKIVTEKLQVAYFENVISDWSIFKEVVLLSNQRFPNNIFWWKSQVDKRLDQVLPWGTAYFCLFVMTITVREKKYITNFGFTHIIKQLMTLDFS